MNLLNQFHENIRERFRMQVLSTLAFLIGYYLLFSIHWKIGAGILLVFVSYNTARRVQTNQQSSP